MEENFEVENESSGTIPREASILLLSVALVASGIVHIGLMYCCADYAFAPVRGEVKSERKWTKELPVMQIQKMSEDPLSESKLEIARPAAAPDTEKPEERVDRLNSAEASSLAPEMPASAASVAASLTESAPAPRKVEPTEWIPRQEIVTIEAPVVPDDQAALPRLVIPKVERVRGGADVTPAFDLMQIPKSTASSGDGNGAFRGVSLASAADKVSAAVPLPLPAALPDTRSSVLTDPFAVSDRPSAAGELTAAETSRAADRAAKAADKINAEKRPVPPAPTTTMVDEKVVASEKEAVRALRDDTTAQGTPFSENVALSLGAWIDPARPNFKYFRITISSKAEKPLPVISKDIVFLMDASGSIANDRLKNCRKAISTALRLLNTGDRFNVVAFRDKFTYAFPDQAWKEVSKDSLEQADDWMAKLTAHGQTDVFRTLRGVLAMPRDPTRPVVALVITDGEATSGMTRSAEIISKFSELNGGLISIFMYGVKENANAYLMDMLTRGSRGTWSRHEGLRWTAAAGIPALATKFQRPVLSDISIMFSASSRSDTYPRLVSNLCEDAPIEIYGMCPADQKELVFSVRGLNGSMVFENMFRLPFGKGETMDSSVRDEWAKRRLYALVSDYTAHPGKKLLGDIRAFAAAYKMAIPYEQEMR